MEQGGNTYLGLVELDKSESMRCNSKQSKNIKGGLDWFWSENWMERTIINKGVVAIFRYEEWIIDWVSAMFGSVFCVKPLAREDCCNNYCFYYIILSSDAWATAYLAPFFCLPISKWMLESFTNLTNSKKFSKFQWFLLHLSVAREKSEFALKIGMNNGTECF